MKKKISRFFRSDLVAGSTTALFGIPAGMAYGKIAGVNPMFGLFSGIAPTILTSLISGTPLMISTATSAIAISTKSVLQSSGGQSEALFTLTFLVGAVMAVFGLLRLGAIIDYVSNAAMTGFIAGASFLIVIGELGGLVGFSPEANGKLSYLFSWISGIRQWDIPTTVLGFAAIAGNLLLLRFPKLKDSAPVIVIAAGTLIATFFDLPQVKLVKNIASGASFIPHFSYPDFSIIPSLLLGAVSIALVALVQGAGVSAALPEEATEKNSGSKDFFAQGLGNIGGGFFQSMPAGGSLTRTAVNVSAGAKSRWSGAAAGTGLLLIAWLGGGLIQQIPIPVISGILCVISISLIQSRLHDIRLIYRTSLESFLVMLATFISALFIDLQWTILLGAALSFLFYLYTQASKAKLHQIIRDEKGYYEMRAPPETFLSNKVTILEFEGNFFFAEIPVIKTLLPCSEGFHNGVVVWRIRGKEDIHTKFLKWLEEFIKKIHRQKNLFLIEGAEPHVMEVLRNTDLANIIGQENIFPAEKGIWMALEKAVDAGEQWISQKNERI